MDTKHLGFNSKLIHGGGHKDQWGSATVPIYQTSTFAFENVDHGAQCFAGESEGYIYTRVGNPTIKALENIIAELENGYGGIAVCSGMAAVTVCYMTLLKNGDHMISTDPVYGSSRGLMENYFSKFGVESTYISTTNIENIKQVLKANTKVLFIETPANPTMDITDIKACADFAHEHGLVVVVDNTFCSPYLQKPLDLGADIVFHSMTKFLNGHADIIAGIVITKEKDLYSKLRTTMVTAGCNMDPHQAYLVLRGLKTLSLRVERAQENALKVAEYLEKHPKVAYVRYPGLVSHPQYALGKQQMKGPGTMISFELKGGLEAGKVLMNNIKLALLAVSLGGVESLIQHPASMTHSKMSPEVRKKGGITDGLVRYSVGIEDVSDLIADLDQALGKIG